MIRVENDEIVFSSGRRETTYGIPGVFGLRGELVTIGVDLVMPWGEDLSREERLELAEHVAAKWRAWAERER